MRYSDGFFSFELDSLTYFCSRKDGRILIQHRPASRFEWSDIVEIELPLDFFTRHTVDDFCRIIERSQRLDLAPLDRQQMQATLMEEGYLPAE